MVSRARRAGLPTWLVRRIADSLGEERARAMLACQLDPAPIAVQVNPLRVDAVGDALVADGAGPLALPGAHVVDRVGGLAGSSAFAHADAVASDYHAQLIAAAATRGGSCLRRAGRGTKTFMMLADAERRVLITNMWPSTCMRESAMRMPSASSARLWLDRQRLPVTPPTSMLPGRIRSEPGPPRTVRHRVR